MVMNLLKGFEHYLAIENDNLSKNIAILEKDLHLILDLDNLYNVCLSIPLPDDPNLRIPAFLSLISHQEFYSGMAAFLRFHKAESFRCLRAALDSTFTAYYLLKYPDEINSYLDKSGNTQKWETLFRNIKLTIKNNQRDFPLAVGLPGIHDLCSKFAHADPEGIFHRYFEDKKEQRLYVHYFDYDKTPNDYKKWYAFILFSFYKIFLIYWNEMLSERAGKKKREIRHLIKEYKAKIYIFRKKYPLLLGN
jgi:hypothetical protein